MKRRANSRWMACQPELGLGMVWRSAVETLCRFKPSADGGSWAACSYEAWLRWYTPLCERGQS